MHGVDDALVHFLPQVTSALFWLVSLVPAPRIDLCLPLPLPQEVTPHILLHLLLFFNLSISVPELLQNFLKNSL
jgi:hypothetical protein